MTLDQLPELMKPAEARAFARVGRNAIYAAIARGDLKAIKLGPHGTRIPKRALIEWAGLQTEVGRQEEQDPGGSQATGDESTSAVVTA